MNPTRAFLPTVLLTLTLPLPLLAQDGPTIGTRITAKKGDSAAFVVHAKQQQSIDMAGQQMEMGNEMKHDVVLRVTDVDDAGNLTLDLKVERIRGSFEMPMMGAIEFDTKSPAKDEEGDSGMGGFGMPDAGTITRLMRPLTQKALVARVSSSGKVQSIEGLDAVLEQAKTAGPTSQMLSGAISEDAIRTLLNNLLGPVPPEPTAVGSSWERAETEKMRTPLKQVVKLTVLDASDSTYKVGMDGTVKSPTDEDLAKLAEEQAGDENAEMTREMMKSMKVKNGKITGSATVDRSTGFVVAGDSKVTMDLTVENPMMGGEANVAVTNTTKIERRSETGGDQDAAKEPAKAGKGEAGKQPAPDESK